MPLLLAVEETATDGVLNAEIWAIVLIAIAAAVAIVARYFKVPFTVLLVVAGLVMAALTEVDVNLSEDLIL
ncbi:hypothetical protein MNBD_ACTINO02-1043, partial [hydrothermal vent metagenome]